MSQHPHHNHDHPHRGGRPAAFAPHSDDSAESIDDEPEGSAARIRAIKISLVILGRSPVSAAGR